MRRRTFKYLNWRYALGEIAFIFIGITTAIWFNNWNEERKLRNVEIKTLKEIRNALKQDFQDIQENIQGFSSRVDVYEALIEHFENQRPLTDSIREIIPYIQGLTTFLSYTGAYETLKSRGFETISNDQIRLEIARYYDYECESIKSAEIRHHRHYQDYLKPAILENFELLPNYRLEPTDYEQLLQNQAFQKALRWAWRIDFAMLQLYKGLETKVEKLIGDLDQEIKRLG